MNPFQTMLEKFRALSHEELSKLMLEALDEHLASATSAPYPSFLTEKEEAVFHSLGFKPVDGEEKQP